MAAYIFRRLLYNIPVFLGVILFVMAALRVHDPVYAYLGKNASPEQYEARKQEMGLDQPFYQQYANFLGKLLLLDLEEESWEHKGVAVERLLRTSVIPSMSLTVPALAITTFLSVCMGMVSAFYRGRLQDKTLVFLAVLGMSVSLLVYIILGQYFGAYRFGEYLGKGNEWFAVSGYEPGLANWPYYCLLPVIISVIVAMGYDTRFYRAVMVEESNRDYITTARAKGASRRKIMFVHMLKNAMIPIITRVMITVPFLITGSIVMEMYFNIPGMGRTLIQAVTSKDFPVIQTFTAVLAAIFIVTNILTDVLYALVDPRVRLT
ncbi:MAG: peptide ABC transporter permease [Planctomycetaceae bacterium]|nr:peptide ABC transporter permease [Planctomycetaceae bacterium]